MEWFVVEGGEDRVRLRLRLNWSHNRFICLDCRHWLCGSIRLGYCYVRGFGFLCLSALCLNYWSSDLLNVGSTMRQAPKGFNLLLEIRNILNLDVVCIDYLCLSLCLLGLASH